MIHRPIESQKYFEYIYLNAKVDFVDNSWKNDASDSVYNEEHKVSIYFPNTDTKDEGNCESFDTFAISFHDNEEMEKKYNSKTYLTVEDVVNEINSILWK